MPRSSDAVCLTPGPCGIQLCFLTFLKAPRDFSRRNGVFKYQERGEQGTSSSSSCKKTLPLMVPFLKACLSPLPSFPKIGVVKDSVSCSSLAYVASHLQLGLHNAP